MPVFLIFVILFALWLRYEIKKTSLARQTDAKTFWEKESASNFVRKKDIDNLDYIKIPLESLPFLSFPAENPSFTPQTLISEEMRSEILSLEKTVLALSEKKILNLTGLSNTEIKLTYGTANLPFLMQYDENFAKLGRTLAKWGKLWLESEEKAAAKSILEYAVSCHIDIEEVFLLLVNLYREEERPEKMKELLSHTSCFDELRRKKVEEVLKKEVK